MVLQPSSSLVKIFPVEKNIRFGFYRSCSYNRWGICIVRDCPAVNEKVGSKPRSSQCQTEIQWWWKDAVTSSRSTVNQTPLHPIVYTHLCSKGEKDIWQTSLHPDFHRIFRLQLWVRWTWEWCHESCLLLSGDTTPLCSLLHSEIWLWECAHPVPHSDLWEVSARPAPTRVPDRDEARDKWLWNEHCI